MENLCLCQFTLLYSLTFMNYSVLHPLVQNIKNDIWCLIIFWLDCIYTAAQKLGISKICNDFKEVSSAHQVSI